MHSNLKNIVGTELYRDWLLSGIDNRDEINMMKLLMKVNGLSYAIRITLVHCCVFTTILKNYIDCLDDEVEESNLEPILRRSGMFLEKKCPDSLALMKIEEGRFGVVYSGIIDGQEVVLKTLRDPNNPESGDLRHEAVIGGILNSIDSDYYMRTHGYVEWPPISLDVPEDTIIDRFLNSDEKVPYLILEPIVESSREFGDFLFRRRRKKDAESIYEVVIMICDALIEGFEKLSFTHGDIHQSNVIVIRRRHRVSHRLHTGGILKTRWAIKIIDLGSSRIDRRRDGTSIIPTNIVISRTIPDPGPDIFRLLRVVLLILTSPGKRMYSTICHIFNAAATMCDSRYSPSESIRQTTLSKKDNIKFIHEVIRNGFNPGASELDMIVNITADLNYTRSLQYLKNVSAYWSD